MVTNASVQTQTIGKQIQRRPLVAMDKQIRRTLDPTRIMRALHGELEH